MSIASRIARSKIDAFGGWDEQIKTQILLQSAAAKAAAEAAGAERKSSHESFLKRFELNSTALAETIKTLKDNPGDEYLQSIYQESLGNVQRSEAELLAFHGYSAKDVAKLDKLVFRTVDEIAKEAKEQGVPFSQKGLWSPEWLKFFKKDFPNLDAQSAEALWKGRISMMGYAGAITGKETKSEGWTEESFPTTGKGQAAELLGVLPDMVTGALNLPGIIGEAAQEWWTGKDADPLYKITDPVAGR